MWDEYKSDTVRDLSSDESDSDDGEGKDDKEEEDSQHHQPCPEESQQRDTGLRKPVFAVPNSESRNYL